MSVYRTIGPLVLLYPQQNIVFLWGGGIFCYHIACPSFRLSVGSLYDCMYEGCPKMPYNYIISLKFKTNISLIHMHPVGNLFLDLLLKLH